MASATSVSRNLSQKERRWLVGVKDKLSRHDGLQLLKILYSEDGENLESELDREQSVFDVYKLSKNRQNRNHSATVALLCYRLGVLVPRPVHADDAEGALDPAKLLRAKDLGAQDCLDYLGNCGLMKPADPSVPPGARFSECFVTAYVNLSPRKRRDFKETLSERVGVYREEQLDLFNLFCRLSRSIDESVADRFMIALNNAEVPSPIFDQLQQQLDSHGIPYCPISEEALKTKEVTEEDYYSETKPPPSIIKHYHNSPCAKVCTISRVACFVISILPLVLLVVAIAASTPTIKSHDESKNEVEKYETSTNLFENTQCHTQDLSTVPVIRLGTISSQWNSGFLIMQDISSKTSYVYKNLDIFVVPAQKVVEYSQPFVCEDIDKDGVELELAGVYFLRGTHMMFNICILSVDQTNGWVDMAVYDTRPSFDSQGNDTLNFHRFYIGANQTHCYPYNYTAPVDSFYYIRMGSDKQCNNSDKVWATYYNMEADMKYVNASDLLSVSEKRTCNRSGYSSEEECTVTFPTGFSLGTQKYEVFARVTSTKSKYDFGHLSIQPLFREESFAIPTIAGLILLVPVELVLLCIIGICCCVCRRKQRTQNNSDIEEHLIEH